jgi:hypothetical protein
MGVLPSLEGADHCTDMVVLSAESSSKFKGAVGTYAASIETAGDATESPTMFTAITLNS